MSEPFSPFNWYWDVLDTNHGTQVYSSAAERFVLVSDANYVAWLSKPDWNNTPTVVSTLASLCTQLNNIAMQYYVAAFAAFTVSANLNLANQVPTNSEFTNNSGTIYNVIMPSAMSPRSIPLGTTVVFRNVSNPGSAVLRFYFNDGTTQLAQLAPGTSVRLTFKDNGTTNGSWVAIYDLTVANAPLSLTSGTLSIDLTAYAALASPTFTGDPKAPTPATADNDTSIATTAFVKAQGYGVGDVTQAGTNTFTGSDYFNLGANLPLVVGHSAKIATTTAIDINGVSGKEGVGNTRWSNDTTGAQILLRKSRGASVGTNTVVSSGDTLGKISFAGNTGTAFQAGGPAVSGVCNSAPFGTNTPGYVLVEAASIGGALVSAATFKDTGCALLGTNTNDSAATGFVGQYKEAGALPASPVSVPTPAVWTQFANLSLEAGDWDVWLTTSFTTFTTQIQASISLSSTTPDTTTFGRAVMLSISSGNIVGTTNVQTRMSLASTTTVYGLVNSASAANSVHGVLAARRVR